MIIPGHSPLSTSSMSQLMFLIFSCYSWAPPSQTENTLIPAEIQGYKGETVRRCANNTSCYSPVCHSHSGSARVVTATLYRLVEDHCWFLGFMKRFQLKAVRNSWHFSWAFLPSSSVAQDDNISTRVFSPLVRESLNILLWFPTSLHYSTSGLEDLLENTMTYLSGFSLYGNQRREGCHEPSSCLRSWHPVRPSRYEEPGFKSFKHLHSLFGNDIA